MPRLLLIILVAITFAPIAGAEFIRFDDAYTLHHNPRLNPPSWQNLGLYWSEWRTGELGLYVPFTYTIWMTLAWAARVNEADAEGSYLNPWVFHSLSIALHIASSLVVLALLQRLTRSRWAAWMGAAFWAVHPVQVESVAWASGMKDVLCGLLSLLAIWSYIRAVEPSPLPPRPPLPSLPPRPRPGFYALSLLCLALALLSKPSAMTVGVLCLIIDWLLIGRPLRRAVMSVAPMLALAVVPGLIARHVQTVDGHFIAPLWTRPLIATDALVFYLRQILFPIHLALDYGRRPELIITLKRTYLLLPMVVVLGLLIWRTRSRELWAAAIWFIAALLPVLGLTVFQFQQFSTTADHYLYVAMFGPALAMAWGVAWAVSRFNPRAVAIVGMIWIAALAARSFAQTRVWDDDFVLFPHVIRVNPQSFLAQHNFGIAYQARGVREGLEMKAALDHDDRAAAEQHRAAQQQDWQNALDHFAAAIKLKRDYYEAYTHYAQIARWMGRKQEASDALLEAAKVHFEDLAGNREDYLRAILKLTRDLNARGQYLEAEQCARLYLELKPDDPDALKELGTARAGDKVPTQTTQPAGL